MTSINCQVFSLIRPGFEPTRFGFPNLPKRGPDAQLIQIGSGQIGCESQQLRRDTRADDHNATHIYELMYVLACFVYLPLANPHFGHCPANTCTCHVCQDYFVYLALNDHHFGNRPIKERTCRLYVVV